VNGIESHRVASSRSADSTRSALARRPSIDCFRPAYQRPETTSRAAVVPHRHRTFAPSDISRRLRLGLSLGFRAMGAGLIPGRSAFRKQRLSSCLHTCASVTEQYNLIPIKGPCGLEGNRRAGVPLAMRYRLKWCIYFRAHQGEEHAAYTPHGTWHT